jgi:hypothetical protein
MKQEGDDTTRRGMNRDGSCLVQKAATRCLDRDGIEAIWLLHLSATQAHSGGYADAAKQMLEIADTAERLWLARVQNDVAGRQESRRITLPGSSKGRLAIMTLIIRAGLLLAMARRWLRRLADHLNGTVGRVRRCRRWWSFDDVWPPDDRLPCRPRRSFRHIRHP